jgi:hypothetical protein
MGPFGIVVDTPLLNRAHPSNGVLRRLCKHLGPETLISFGAEVLVQNYDVGICVPIGDIGDGVGKASI